MRSVWGEFIRMIFVTTGSQKFQFNRLLQKIDLLIEEGMIREKVFAQVQLLREFDGMNLICACYDSEKLGDCIRDTGSRDFAGYHSNTRRILKDIENFLIAEEGENHGKHSKIS